MSEQIKHECGIALIRLLKPLEYYQYKYGTWKYGLNKLYLLMEKQHNRGQDGAGVHDQRGDLPGWRSQGSRIPDGQKGHIHPPPQHLLVECHQSKQDGDKNAISANEPESALPVHHCNFFLHGCRKRYSSRAFTTSLGCWFRVIYLFCRKTSSF